MTKPRTAGRRSRRAEILVAALNLYSTRGVAAVTASELGRTLAMTATAIRYHFPTTDDLVHALADPFLADLEEALRKHAKYPAWPQEVRELIVAFVSSILRYRDVALLIHGDRYLAAHADFGGRLNEASYRVRNAIAGPKPSPAQTAAAMAAVGGLWRPIQLLEAGEVRQHLDEIIAVVLSGHLRSESPAGPSA
jgi:AcrR family transcriptional regulator